MEKRKVHEECLRVTEEKIQNLRKQLEGLKKDRLADTKSSAGDKHETTQAMMQQEIDKTEGPLAQLEIQKNFLEMINPEIESSTIVSGSLVETDQGWFYLSSSLGKIQVDKIQVFALSPGSPLGKVLSGKKANDSVSVNGKNYRILSIY